MGSHSLVIRSYFELQLTVFFFYSLFLMFIFRNNLTVLDGIVVQGQGARGEFTLNCKRPGSHSTLLFEIKPNQLVDCHSKFLCSGLKVFDYLVVVLLYHSKSLYL